MVLATPILAVVMVIVQMVYIEDILGDKNTEINEENLEEFLEKEDIQRENAEVQSREDLEIQNTEIKSE